MTVHKSSSTGQMQASLQVPLNNDLSQWMSDCLLAGTIPLVPTNVRTIGHYFPKEIKDLGLVEYDINAPASIIAALTKRFQFLINWETGDFLRHEGQKPFLRK